MNQIISAQQNKNARKFKIVVSCITAAIFLTTIAFACGCNKTTNVSTVLKSTISNGQTVQTSYNDTENKNGMSHFDGYTLQQMTVLSRHNLRSPIQGENSKIDQITPNKWFKWTSKSSELSLKGQQEEEMFGQYFKLFLEKEGFIPTNWIPSGNETYFYSNSLQRTIATAQDFITGFIPVGGSSVYHKYDLGTKDPTFSADMLFDTPKWEALVQQELNELGGEEGLTGYYNDLEKSFKVLNEILNFKNSTYAKENNKEELSLDGAGITFDRGVGGEIHCTGDLDIANEAGDALILQYFEEEDDSDAGFNKVYNDKEWAAISKICDYRQYTNFGLHAIGVNIGHNMLVELQKNMHEQGRKFSFICGHDATINSVLGAMRVCDYSLPNQITKRVPIGSKLVINRYTDNKTGEQYIRACIVYETTDQIRHRDTITLENPPMEYQLAFKDMTPNEHGMYKLADFEARLQKAIDEFDELQ